MECIPSKKHICTICNKEYSTRQNLWKHNNKFHVIVSNESKLKVTENDEIIQKNEKYNCKGCKAKFNNITDLDSHTKLKCKPDIKHNNVFKFNTNTFGKNKYPDDNGGDIYIIQTDFSLKGYYKIGITTNLYHRMSDYRCGAVIEPRIHCYFPVKNIKKADNLMKVKLLKYNIKREIYKVDNLIEVKTILKELQKEMSSEELEVLPEIKNCDMVECEYCNTVYTSYYELKIHLVNCQKNAPKNVCDYCKKFFSRSSSLKRHYDKCKYKDTKETVEVTQLKEQLKEKDKFYEKKLEEFKKQMLDIIKKSCKIHPKTLQKINNQLNNNNSNNNNTINNTYIVQFGKEKLYEVFTKKEQIDVLNCGNLCLENLIEKAHFNSKYPQFKNILITNLQNNLAYKYNTTTSNFDVVTKKELLEEIISERMYDIEEFFNKYKDDISDKMQTIIESFISKMDNESYEENKKQNIKIILYNNRTLVDKANMIDNDIIV